MEITFRFVVELSEETMQFLLELVDELKHGEDRDEDE
jgi:hypothetical protein